MSCELGPDDLQGADIPLSDVAMICRRMRWYRGANHIITDATLGDDVAMSVDCNYGLMSGALTDDVPLSHVIE